LNQLIRLYYLNNIWRKDILNILVTGNNGYIGTVLTKTLVDQGYKVIGYDINFFEQCKLEEVKTNYFQIIKDIRNVDIDDLDRVDAIIHLAGLSNDPLGEFDTELTKQINYNSTIKLAVLAKEVGIKRFVYASSQSMYGISNISNELDEYDSKKNPVTAYAKTKWDAELELVKMHSEEFVVSCFRPSTVFGVSPRLRCDIVFNNLVACAYTTGKIEILSDGSPWRPVVHVKDVCQAFIAGLRAPSSLINGKSFNVGVHDGNYTVRELAEAAQRAVSGSELIFLNEHTDPRTYKVSFTRILNDLAEYYKPNWDLDKGGNELVKYFDKVNFTENDFRGKTCNRLAQLKYLRENQIIDNQLGIKTNDI